MARRTKWGNVMGGVALVAVLHFAAFWLYLWLLAILGKVNSGLNIPLLTHFLQNYVWLGPLFLPGLMQIFYVMPVIWVFQRRRQAAVVQGMVIGAVMTVLLNGVCLLAMR